MKKATLLQVGLGHGIYSIPEASRLTRIAPQRVRRWVKGYSFHSKTGERLSPALFQPEFEPVDESFQLSFLDLMEVRLIDRFRSLGISWKEIRRAARTAAEMLQTAHPFATHQFLTDGRKIFAEISGESEDVQLVELSKSQQVFQRVVRPYLHDVEFRQDLVCRWWPLGLDRHVVIDPDRSFGRPIGRVSGVPTEVIAQAAFSLTPRQIASWYDMPIGETRDALRYEQKLAA